ncbi:MAG: glycosyltransferase [Gammaproteobacteria bacterium]|nr:glycosyltransferase [Gammaproteobacteria bacterium]
MNTQRLLLLLGQSPFDPTSGAAQSMRQMAELLAGQGMAVRALATTACEGDSADSHAKQIAAGGWRVRRVRSFHLRQRYVLEIVAGTLHHELIEVDPRRKHCWERDVGAVYAAHLHRVITEFKPGWVLTFGGDPTDVARRAVLRAAGACVVFALHNLAYLHNRPAECDVFLAPSQFLAERYRNAWGIPVATLPPPLAPDTVLAATHDPIFVTFFNPEPAKGLWLMARLAERLGRERPDIPLLVVEGRGRAADLIAAGRAAGVDLTRYPNLMFTPPMARVADIWANCRVLLMPSVVEEAAGRVAMEAMANGAVPVVGDRGGIPEIVGHAGIVLPLPTDYTLASHAPLPLETVTPWFDAVTRLVDDKAGYAQFSQAARSAAAVYLPDRLGPRYREWFEAHRTLNT